MEIDSLQHVFYGWRGKESAGQRRGCGIESGRVAGGREDGEGGGVGAGGCCVGTVEDCQVFRVLGAGGRASISGHPDNVVVSVLCCFVFWRVIK